MRATSRRIIHALSGHVTLRGFTMLCAPMNTAAWWSRVSTVCRITGRAWHTLRFREMCNCVQLPSSVVRTRGDVITCTCVVPCDGMNAQCSQKSLIANTSTGQLENNVISKNWESYQKIYVLKIDLAYAWMYKMHSIQRICAVLFFIELMECIQTRKKF